MALFENIVVNCCRLPAVWLDLFQEYPFLAGYVRVVTLSDVSASWIGSLSLLVQLLSSGHPLAVLRIAWTTFSAQIQDILADVWRHFPRIIIQKCTMTSEDFAFVLTRTCRLTSLCLGFVDRGLAKPLSSIFPTSNRPSLYSSGIALTSFHYFMEVGALSFLRTDAYIQGVKPMLRALRELRTRSVYSVLPEIQSPGRY